MRLRDINNDKAMDILCDLTVPLATIGEDKELIKAMLKRITVGDKTSEEEKKALGFMQTVKNCKVLIPKLLKEHRSEVYEILSIINEKDIEEIRKQNPIMTINQIKELFQDEELISFFSSQVKSEKEPSSISVNLGNTNAM